MSKTLMAGIFYGIAADLFWGLAFIVPKLLPSYSAIEIIFGRYLVFGILSVILWINEGQKGYELNRSIFIKAVLIAFCGNIGYYFFLVFSIQLAGPTIATLINGILPVTISLCGNWLNREFPVRKILIPILVTLCGILTLNYSSFIYGADGGWNAYGIICSIIALLLWTWYGVANALFLKDNPQIPPKSWATITGAATLCLLPIFMAITQAAAPEAINMSKMFAADSSAFKFWVGCMVLGVIVSWLAYFLWNKASKDLPIALAGQLIVGETIFGLCYSFIIYGRFPSIIELIGIVLAVGGVLYCIRLTNGLTKSYGSCR